MRGSVRPLAFSAAKRAPALSAAALFSAFAFEHAWRLLPTLLPLLNALKRITGGGGSGDLGAAAGEPEHDPAVELAVDDEAPPGGVDGVPERALAGVSPYREVAAGLHLLATRA